jgi:hypothetical protein
MQPRSTFFSVTGFGALLAAFSVWLHGSDRKPAARDTAPAAEAQRRGVTISAADSTSALLYTRGRELLAAYYGEPVESLLPRARTSSPLDSHIERLKVLIATVPDPVESHLDWSYDAYVESIQRAMSVAGYVPDRFWLPQTGDSIAWPERGSRRRIVAQRAVFPGVLLFRSTAAMNDTGALALVYLVTELPTSGINKDAFATAARERALLLESDMFVVDSAERNTMRIVGPSFSGSAVSLRLALIRALSRGSILSARVTSGSATRVDSGAFGSNVTFATTIHSDSAMLSIADVLLRRLGIESRDVAVLSEAATLYGQGVSAFERRDATASSEGQPGMQLKSATAPDTGYYQFTFPLHFALLRSEYVRDGLRDDAQRAPLVPNSPSPRLSLAEQQRTGEIPAVMAPSVTVPSLDLALRELKAGLVRHGIRAVIIRATDIRDKLMLARELKQSNRDLTLILMENHLLYSRPDYEQYLRGAYVLSSYPLSLENQWWSPTSASDRSRFAFTSDAAVGVFNAVLTQLGEPEMRREFSHWVPGSVTRQAGPPIWVSIIARGGVVPLAAYRPNAAELLRLGVPTGASLDTTNFVIAPHEPTRELELRQVVLVSGSSIVLALLLLTLRRSADAPIRFRSRTIVPACSPLLGVRRPRLRDAEPCVAAPVPEDEKTIRENEPRYAFSVSREAMFTGLLLVSAALLSLQLTAPTLLSCISARCGETAWLKWTWRLAAISVLLLAMFVLVSGVLDAFRGVRRAWDVLRKLHRSQQARSGSTTQCDAGPQCRWCVTNDERAELRAEAVSIVLLCCYAIATSVACVVFFALAYRITRTSADTAVAFLLRDHIGMNGVAPFTPLVIVSACTVAWSWWQLRQLRTIELRRTPFEEAINRYHNRRDAELQPSVLVPAPMGVDEGHYYAERVLRADRRVSRYFTRFLPLPLAAAASLPLIGAILVIVMRHVGYPESVVLGEHPWLSRSFDVLVMIGPLFLCYIIASATMRLYFCWMATAELTEAVAERAMDNAFGRLPKTASRLIRAYLIGSADDDNEQATAVEMSAQCARAYGTIAPVRLKSINAGRGAGMALLRPHDNGSVSIEERVQLTSALFECTVRAWRVLGPGHKVGREEANASPPDVCAGTFLRRAEEYLAFEAVIYLETILLNLRRNATFLLVALVLSTVLVSSYPLAPDSLIKSTVLVLLVIAIVVLFGVMSGMSKNALLSRLSDTDPGRITWDTTFIFNLVIFSVLPLLVLVSSEFPMARSVAFAWTEPALKSFLR